MPGSTKGTGKKEIKRNIIEKGKTRGRKKERVANKKN